MPQNCNLEDVAHIKKFVDIPVVCAGRMEPDVGAQAVAEGRIDGVGIARQFLADGEWITKLIEERLEDIRPCICCHNGCFTMTHYKGIANGQPMGDVRHMARCALNPETMQTKKYKIVPAKKKVVIDGGSIGGMEAAAPSFKEKDRDLIAWYQREIFKYPIEVKLNTEVKNVETLQAEEVIVATGAVARTIPVKGVEHAMDAVEYLLGEKEVGENVTIIGGGLTECEIAYDLYLQGKKPTIVEMKNDLIAVKGICLANASYLECMGCGNEVIEQ